MKNNVFNQRMLEKNDQYNHHQNHLHNLHQQHKQIKISAQLRPQTNEKWNQTIILKQQLRPENSSILLHHRKYIHLMFIYYLLWIIGGQMVNSLPFIPNEKNENFEHYDRRWNNIYNNDQKNYSKDMCTSDQCWSFSEKLHSSMDTNINPCEDFYQFTCRKWIIEHPIPLHTKAWSQFMLFAYQIKDELKQQLEKAQPFKLKNMKNVFEKLRQFYNVCLNTKQRNDNGYNELFELIESLGGWPMLDGRYWDKNRINSFRWERAFVTLAKLNIYYLINIGPMIDLRNTSKITIKLGPPYLSSENIINLRHQYLKTESESMSNDDIVDTNKLLYLKIVKEMRNHKHHNNLFLNDTELKKDIDDVFNLQEELQNRTSGIFSMSYFQKHYEKHLINITTIKQMVDFDILFILQTIFDRNFKDDELLFVPDIDYLKKLNSLLKMTPKRILANYFSANMVYQLGSHTTTKMFELLIAKLEAPEILPNMCFGETALYLPELLGQVYLNLYFDRKNTRNNINSIVNLLRKSFRQLLQESQWMDNYTIKAAIKKLEWMDMNIAYPQWYNNETTLSTYFFLYETAINPANYIRSVINVNQVRNFISYSLYDKNIFEIPNEKHPITLSWPRRQIIDVNAFYYFTTNGVYIPAGILQDAIYSSHLPGAITFGSIGMILGHEMTHAFDNSGQLYDEHGALRNWWTNETKMLFSEKTNCFVEQYSNYSINKAKINGIQTLAENIADNGGIREAYRAFKTYQSLHRDEKWRLPGKMSQYTPDQLFFISFAHMWCANIDQKAILDIVNNNEHSPPSIRVKGSLANFDRFSEAFNCPLNSPMNPERKCILW